MFGSSRLAALSAAAMAMLTSPSGGGGGVGNIPLIHYAREHHKGRKAPQRGRRKGWPDTDFIWWGAGKRWRKVGGRIYPVMKGTKL